jgi:Transposase IS116/IS110/IS902 family.
MFYGIDLSSESFAAVVLDEKGDEMRRFTCSLEPQYIGKFLSRLKKDDYVAAEASTNTFWFAEQVAPFVKECFIINTWKFKTITGANQKTDYLDAEKLANRLKYHVLFDKSEKEFPLVYKPVKQVQIFRTFFTTYNIFKKQKNVAENRVRSLFKQNGMFGLKKLKLYQKAAQEKILAKEMREEIRFQVKMLFDTINYFVEKMDELKEKILVESRIFQKEIEILTSIKGISPFVAAAIMADVVDINRFSNVKKFCSYLRAAPKIKESGDSTKIGKINKQSRSLTMGLMVECVNHFRNSSDKVDKFYIKKCNGKSKGKVRIAVVRKILVAIYNMLKYNKLYYYVDKNNHNNKLVEYARVLKKAA